MKRGLDVVASACGMILLFPLLLVIAIAIVIDSGRPVLFRQERVGRHGKPFEIIKFRSMKTTSNRSMPLVTTAGDARITRVGGWLRSTKLDELPQLWNVLRGELSIVGPRPEVQGYVDMWPEDDRAIILSIRPGITDPASTKYRREEDLLAGQPDPEAFYRTVVLPDKVRLYREYVESQSLAVDLRVLAGTAQSIVTK